MKITKSRLKQIIKEELEGILKETNGELKLVHEPKAMDPNYACIDGYAYDGDLHLCIREDITAQRLREDPALGIQLNREVAKLRGR